MEFEKNNFTTFVNTWIEDNRYPSKDTESRFLSSLLVIGSISQHGFHFSSGLGPLQVTGYFDRRSPPRLVQASIQLEVPSWGKVLLASNLTIALNRVTQVPVTIDQIHGRIFIDIARDITTDAVTVQYDLNTPYGPYQGHHALFATTQTNLLGEYQDNQVLSDDEVSQLQLVSTSPGKLVEDSSSGKYWQVDDLGVHDEVQAHELLSAFIRDFAFDQEKLALQTDTTEAPNKALGGALESIDVSFLGIFSFVGSIDTENLGVTAALYVRVPLLGRVKITSISGSLRNGVSADINVAVAKGKITIRIDSGYVVLDLEASIKLVGTKKITGFRLFKLPF